MAGGRFSFPPPLEDCFAYLPEGGKERSLHSVQGFNNLLPASLICRKEENKTSYGRRHSLFLQVFFLQPEHNVQDRSYLKKAFPFLKKRCAGVFTGL